MIDAAGRRFRPTFWATLCTLAALAVLIGLGTWQLQRLHWKEDLIAERRARSSAAPIALPQHLEDPAALEFLRVRLQGRFLHDKELYLGARSLRGVVGYDVVTPLLLDDGRSLLIDRGWVPPERKDPATRRDGQPAGPVTLEALLRSGGWKGPDFVKPENRPEENFWFWVDPQAMASWAGLERPITEVYAEAAAGADADALPIGGQSRVELRNDHLQYAITWYALALALLVIYIVFSSRGSPQPRAPG